MAYEIVTFDVFDTLVHRRLRAPVDVFEAVRQSVLQSKLALLNHDLMSAFAHNRIQAEQQARTELVRKTNGEGEVNFDEIYDQFQKITGCAPDIRQLLQRTELELEKNYSLRVL